MAGFSIRLRAAIYYYAVPQNIYLTRPLSKIYSPDIGQRPNAPLHARLLACDRPKLRIELNIHPPGAIRLPRDEQRPVFYADLENPLPVFRERLDLLGLDRMSLGDHAIGHGGAASG